MNETAERSFRILVVEDDAQISRVLRLELEHEGYAVDLAVDGLAGLEKALKEPDLVILDLMLPKMDGLEVCKRIRAKSRVPIIMLTAKDRIPERVAGLDTGARLTGGTGDSNACRTARRCTPCRAANARFDNPSRS